MEEATVEVDDLHYRGWCFLSTKTTEFLSPRSLSLGHQADGHNKFGLDVICIYFQLNVGCYIGSLSCKVLLCLF